MLIWHRLQIEDLLHACEKTPGVIALEVTATTGTKFQGGEVSVLRGPSCMSLSSPVEHAATRIVSSAGAPIAPLKHSQSLEGHMSAALALCTLLTGKGEVWAYHHVAPTLSLPGCRSAY